MLKFTELVESDSPADDVLTLPFEARQKSRLPARTDNGIEIGLFLPRGQRLRPGLVLTGQTPFRVRVKAASEQVSVVRCADPLKFAKVCYHLGNRHVALQILPGELRYLTDHVLDHMVQSLGLQVENAELPFEPESGAYHSHDH